MFPDEIKQASLYLSWKLPPYYGESNLYDFYKKLNKFLPNQFTQEEMIFIQKLSQYDDEKIYYSIIDHLNNSIKDYCATCNMKNKLDIRQFLMDIWVPDCVIMQFAKSCDDIIRAAKMQKNTK